MNRAFLIHGKPNKEDFYSSNSTDSESNRHWLPWLQLKLLQKDIFTQTPEMPRPFDPIYADWKAELDRFTPDEETLLVGHSCGAGFLIRLLSENPDIRINKVVLVAPWIDVEGKNPDMFKFDLGADISKQVINGIDVIYSTDDQETIQTSLSKIRSNISGLRYHKFENYGHFTFSQMKTREFTELLDICLGK